MSAVSLATAGDTVASAGVRIDSFAERHRKLRTATAAAGADVLVAYGSGVHVFIGSNPAWYVSGFKQMGPHIAAVLPVDGAPFLVVTPKWDLARARDRSVIADVVACDPADFLVTLEAELRRRGLAARRGAIALGEQTTQHIAVAMPNLFNREPVPAARFVSDIARIRDPWSMECTRRGVAIAEESYDWLLHNVRPGMREFEVAAELEIRIRELGAEDNFQLMSSSQHNRSVHMPTDRIMAEGDVLLGEITPAVDGEYIQICRTAVLGEISEAQRNGFALLDHALREGMRTATPGTPVEQVVEAINAPIAAAGHERYTRPPYHAHARAQHGDGLDGSRDRVRHGPGVARRHGLRDAPQSVSARCRLYDVRRTRDHYPVRRPAAHPAHGNARIRSSDKELVT